jgi:ATP-binding protein involved in chromosome partitioning
MPAPLSIEGLGKSVLTITWEDDHRGAYPARYLRSRCRCAECIEEMTGRKLLDDAAIPSDLRCEQIELVGGYAVSIAWSDGHRTGIYSFKNLRSWCPCADCAKTPKSG